MVRSYGLYLLTWNWYEGVLEYGCDINPRFEEWRYIHDD